MWQRLINIDHYHLAHNLQSMKHLVTKFLFVLGIIFSSSFSKAQELIKFNSQLDKSIERRLSLEDFLSSKVPYAESGDCSSTYGFFYFRVNYQGDVDSLYFDGNLRQEVIDMVIHNIHATKKSWEISSSFSKIHKEWFIFPFFDFGGTYYETSNCSELEKQTQKDLLRLSTELGRMHRYIQTKNKILLRPALKGGPFIDL